MSLVSDNGREDWLIERFERGGVIHLSGHFVGKSLFHLDCYVDKDVVTSDPMFMDELANLLVMMNDREWVGKVDLVVAPAVGAILFGGMLAHHLGCRFAFTEKIDQRQNLRSSFVQLIKQETRVLIAEDIITKGGTIAQVADEVIKLGGAVVGAAVIWNRGRAELGFSVRSVISRELPAWEEEKCQLCKEKVPINSQLGHGSDFLLKYGEDPENWPANKMK